MASLPGKKIKVRDIYTDAIWVLQRMSVVRCVDQISGTYEFDIDGGEKMEIDAIPHGCSNCGRNNFRNQNKDGFCKYDNTKRYMAAEKAQECPFWAPSPYLRAKDVVDDNLQN